MQARNTYTRPLLLVGFVLASLFHSFAAHAQTNALERIRQSKTVNMGIREGAKPFSFFTEPGKPAGYTVELCHKVVEQLRKELKLSELKVNYVGVSAANRIEKVKTGAVDFECGMTTNTKSRQAEADFSHAFFMSGEQVLSRADSGISDLNSLNGKTIAITKGTTAEKLFTQLRDNQLQQMKLVVFTSNQEAFKALESRQVSGFAQLDVVLESLRSQAVNPAAFVMSKESLSVEPQSIMLARDNPELKALINRSLRAVYASNEINTLYDKWFNTPNFNIPQSKMQKEAISRPSSEPAVALMLGYAL